MHEFPELGLGDARLRAPSKGDCNRRGARMSWNTGRAPLRGRCRSLGRSPGPDWCTPPASTPIEGQVTPRAEGRATATFRANATWRGAVENELDDGRGHSYLIDVTPDEGGHDKGTSGFELGLLSLAGCVNAVFALVAQRRKLLFSHMRTELVGERPRKAPTYTAVRGVFRIRTSAPKDEVETALALTVRICPIGALFEKAKIPVDIRAVITAPDDSEEGAGNPAAPPPAA